ncbi:hypothetical protein [Gorillibacterium massiliense]|nr:hypothetical protein [Gorillibacterium massiliense]
MSQSCLLQGGFGLMKALCTEASSAVGKKKTKPRLEAPPGYRDSLDH